MLLILLNISISFISNSYSLLLLIAPHIKTPPYIYFKTHVFLITHFFIKLINISIYFNVILIILYDIIIDNDDMVLLLINNMEDYYVDLLLRLYMYYFIHIFVWCNEWS